MSRSIPYFSSAASFLYLYPVRLTAGLFYVSSLNMFTSYKLWVLYFVRLPYVALSKSRHDNIPYPLASRYSLKVS